jgi:hypothetical protein
MSRKGPNPPCGKCNKPDALPHRVAGMTTYICGDCWVDMRPGDKLAYALSDPWRKVPR